MSDETTYRVKGMACEGCVATVSEALAAALPGVAVHVVLDGGGDRHRVA